MDRKTLATYTAKANHYATLVSRGTPDQDLQTFIDAIPTNGVVLDLGCGPGNSAAMMRDAGLQVEATDACAEMVQLAKDQYGIDARLETFDQLTAKGHYHGIWANFSLLHAVQADIPVHLTQIHNALRIDGYFHIGMKLGSGEKRDKIGRFYSFYSEEDLTNLLINCGFEPEYKRQGEGKGLAGTVEPFIIIQSRKANA
ncbi:class I SAM-dependent methyltransferase [Parasulfitobacter algicola]|uniref:Class I SAM-dependent methyltransferase n=1 Tax=Parasulfitobacter algicola TaxID=2614809 RepID=A0ABX2INL1_9RHOB|nr:class I SAM-dependent methyltransferase [Sulfitobacter algicola]NSX53945.1 class I SAM-dependent methyltransferase [Sulfitobacter algicola]